MTFLESEGSVGHDESLLDRAEGDSTITTITTIGTAAESQIGDIVG